MARTCDQVTQFTSRRVEGSIVGGPRQTEGVEHLKSERSIELAIAEGSLAENAHLDVKRETGATDSSRTETARDLASFAIFGGSLLIGIDEDKTSRTFSAAPQPLEGLAERVEQIAANRVDPPLFVRVHDVPTEADPSLGFLLVEVPPSSQAPHMVDGRYYARGDRTKRRLTDAEVSALHAARVPAARRIRDFLKEWSSRRVVPEGYDQQLGHLKIVGMPLTAIPAGSFLGVSRAANNTSAFELATFAVAQVPTAFKNFSPSLRSGQHWVRRRDGSALTTLDPGVPQLGPEGREHSLVDFEVRDDGSFGILMGRLTDRPATWRGDTGGVVFDFPAAGYAWQAVRAAIWISSQTGYRGSWGFGLKADGLAEHHSWELVNNNHMFRVTHPYSADDFSSVTSGSLAEIEDAPEAVTERLIGGLLHGLGSYEAFKSVLDSSA